MATAWRTAHTADGAIIWQLVEDHAGMIAAEVVREVVGDWWPDGTPMFVAISDGGRDEHGIAEDAADARAICEISYEDAQRRDFESRAADFDGALWGVSL